MMTEVVTEVGHDPDLRTGEAVDGLEVVADGEDGGASVGALDRANEVRAVPVGPPPLLSVRDRLQLLERKGGALVQSEEAHEQRNQHAEARGNEFANQFVVWERGSAYPAPRSTRARSALKPSTPRSERS